VSAARRTLVEAGPALWEADVEAGEGQTRVVVRRGAGRRTQDRIVVAEIPDGAADWQERLLLAQQEAESRAAVLNSG
jgi:hypothetical protein